MTTPADANPPSPDTQSAFVKRRAGAPPHYYRLEADGLRWLARAGAAAVPSVLEVGEDRLVLARITTQVPQANDAARFGAELARTHRAGAGAYGSPPPGAGDPAPATGFIADLTLPFGAWQTFGPFYAQARIVPYLTEVEHLLSVGQRAVFAELIQALNDDDEQVTGPAEPPSRVHGDLWSGNVVWGGDAQGETRGWLIDPAAHGGHRETDLAMLALFGAPHLGSIIEAYHRENPLAPGWRRRVPLHQIHPLLVHSVLFGGGYLNRAAAAARTAMSGRPPSP